MVSGKENIYYFIILFFQIVKPTAIVREREQDKILPFLTEYNLDIDVITFK
jgi:hypothetical protein